MIYEYIDREVDGFADNIGLCHRISFDQFSERESEEEDGFYHLTPLLALLACAEVTAAVKALCSRGSVVLAA